MPALLILASAVACAAHPLSLKQAEALVMAAPNIRAAATERGAKPVFEWVDPGPEGWRFDVNSDTPCASQDPCSKLLGHYTVNRTTGEVVDLDADEDGKVVSSPGLTKLRLKLLHPSGC
ncbi:MAG TPA: hypothetical protein VFW13_07375 [Phenylobacterium sp.]|nr:hypothetical protein [Phenylobacterium sp.]